ncbi:hypothetical protein E2C01_077838 [Portunus trituberculatus]|uniref:Uncharacterized protein n=1 Tax=Portunus trituberculatus TaxID=210409 RepID=A0A5B7IL74_PORTR|nr:hypothetical protein [Portunus trituberculatus]
MRGKSEVGKERAKEEKRDVEENTDAGRRRKRKRRRGWWWWEKGREERRVAGGGAARADDSLSPQLIIGRSPHLFRRRVVEPLTPSHQERPHAHPPRTQAHITLPN